MGETTPEHGTMLMVCLCDEDASCEHGLTKLRALMKDDIKCLLFVRNAAGEHVPLADKYRND